MNNQIIDENNKSDNSNLTPPKITIPSSNIVNNENHQNSRNTYDTGINKNIFALPSTDLWSKLPEPPSSNEISKKLDNFPLNQQVDSYKNSQSESIENNVFYKNLTFDAWSNNKSKYNNYNYDNYNNANSNNNNNDINDQVGYQPQSR